MLLKLTFQDLAYCNLNCTCHSIFLFFEFRISREDAALQTTVKPQWLEHLWDHGNLFETLGSSSH